MTKKVLDKRFWRWNTKKHYSHWYCYFTKYGRTTRLIRLIGK